MSTPEHELTLEYGDRWRISHAAGEYYASQRYPSSSGRRLPACVSAGSDEGLRAEMDRIDTQLAASA